VRSGVEQSVSHSNQHEDTQIANRIAKKKKKKEKNSGPQSRNSEERYQMEKISHTKVVLSQSIVVISLLFREVLEIRT
jgi:hypothetical protein